MHIPSSSAMENSKCFIFFFYVFTLAFMLMGTVVNGCGHKGAGIRKLFVFGDSYADTGNLGKFGPELTRAWYRPYGTTFPHRPTGRFSDGRILTDYFASFLGIKSPLPYKNRRVSYKLLPYGMNFAVGGTGVFDTGNLQRNLTAQIDAFEGQIGEGVFSDCDLKSSIALVAISGNDYSYYMDNGGTMNGMFEFMDKLIGRLKLDLKRLRDIGVRKVVVTNMSPLGCTPYVTRVSNYTSCNETVNSGAMLHNSKLQDTIGELAGATDHSGFLSLDLYSAFVSITDPFEGARKKSLKPCCDGKTDDMMCGQIDEHGLNQYTLCCNPEDYFYWDDVHPTEAGWGAAFDSLEPSLRKFLL